MSRCIGVVHHTPVVRHVHRHHVHPLGMGGKDDPGNIAVACPNLHAATHQLLRITGVRYTTDDGPVTPWWIRRHFPVAARDLAYDGWWGWHNAGRPVAQERWIWQGAPIAVDLLGLARLGLM